MTLELDEWNVEARPGGWLRLKEISEAGPSVFLQYKPVGVSGQERLDLHLVVMRSGEGEPLSGRLWRRIPLSQIEKALNLVLSFARSAPTPGLAEAGQQAVDWLRAEGVAAGVKAPTLDELEEYFASEKPLTMLAFSGLPSGMLTSDGSGDLPAGRVPHLKAPDGRLTDDFLKDVADVYRWASDTGQAPAPTIAEMTAVPVRTVHRWVYEARKRGILPPARVGRAG